MRSHCVSSPARHNHASGTTVPHYVMPGNRHARHPEAYGGKSMRFTVLVGLILLQCCQCFGEQTAPKHAIKLVGDETSLLKVKADPRAFLSRPVIIIGRVEIGDHYGGGGYY